MDLRKALKALRKHTRESQQAFSTRLGLAIRTLAFYEAGRRPEPRVLILLARAAEDAGRRDLADIFLAALAQGLGLHKNIGFLGARREEGKLVGELFLSLEGEQEVNQARAFYQAILKGRKKS